MTVFVFLVAIAQSFAISLGVGSSTLAIVNFFVAIADGKIDDTERKMMGVVYIVLRIAMVLILLTSLTLIGLDAVESNLSSLSMLSYAQLTALAILFLNATLMTAHIMPSTFGPAIQAGSWYTLGVLTAMGAQRIVDFSYLKFLLGYVTWLVLAIAIVNGFMAWFRAHRHGVLK